MSKILHLPRRLTDVLSRIRFDVGSALKYANRRKLWAAAGKCRRCREGQACDAWVISHAEGENNSVPSFCPNGPFIQSHRPHD